MLPCPQTAFNVTLRFISLVATGREHRTLAVIERLARDLRRSHQSYDTLLILYYLPGQDVGAGAWGTSHFRPDLQISIFGERVEETPPAEEPETENLIGQWRDNAPGMANRIRIESTQSGYQLVQTFDRDGSSHTIDVTRDPRNQNRFNTTDTSDHFVITSDGLEIRDADGLIRRARPE